MASLVALRAASEVSKVRWAMPTKMQSTIRSWLIRLARAPGRKAVSLPAETRTWSASSAREERGLLVTATVVAPARRATRMGASTSGVSPVQLTATATSSSRSRAALVNARCASV